MKQLNNSFFTHDVIDVAQQLIGKVIARKFESGEIRRYRITETEAYRGEDDLACHASKGRTARTDVMYQSGGKIYVYLIYGMYWMLNVVTGEAQIPSAVLIRGVEGFPGPGKVGRELLLDKTFYGENLSLSDRIWIEGNGTQHAFSSSKRVGIDYAGEWANKPWRFTVQP